MPAHVKLTTQYLYLFAHSGVQHILCWDFAMFFFVLCTISCPFLWIVHFWLHLRYSLTFILKYVIDSSSLLPFIFQVRTSHKHNTVFTLESYDQNKQLKKKITKKRKTKNQKNKKKQKKKRSNGMYILNSARQTTVLKTRRIILNVRVRFMIAHSICFKCSCYNLKSCK